MVKLLRKFLNNRKGTAEVIGSIMFIVILLFFFTNVYLWHDAAVKEANALYLKQVNAGMELKWDENGNLVVTAKGSDVDLSRLWIVTSDGHYYANLEGVQVLAGKPVTITLEGYSFNPDGSIKVESNRVYFDNLASDDKLSVLNTLGVSVPIRK